MAANQSPPPLTVAPVRGTQNCWRFSRPDAVMGLCLAVARKVAVSDDVSTGSSCVAPSIGREDSHGTLCRDRCVVGSIECVRGGWKRQDLARSEGDERTGFVGAVLQGTGLRGDADRDRSLSTVAMAACRAHGSGFCSGAAGGASRQGGDLCDGGEDRPQR